jgi:3',5'-cyclic-AMP phosphodiesterase
LAPLAISTTSGGSSLSAACRTLARGLCLPLCLLALLALPILLVSCGDSGEEPSPSRPAYLYEPVAELTEPELVTVSDTEAVFTWVTDSLSDAHVYLGSGEPLAHYDRSGPPARYHHARITGLRPATEYRYVLQSGEVAAPDTERSPGTFTTLQTPPGEFLFSFATVNDTHVGEEVAGLICIGDGVCLNEGFESPWPDDPYWSFTNRAVVSMINRIMPDFVIHKGDVSSRSLEEEFVAAREIFDGLQVPFHVLRGNHDRAGDRPEDYFREVFSLETPWRHFVHRGHLFVLLDSANPLTGQPEIGEEQFRWLEETLSAHRGLPALVFLHHAVTAQAALWCLPPADRDRLVGLLAAHGDVRGVFSGHSHRAAVTQDDRMPGVPFVETPSTKEYPGGFCLYRVYSGGMIQTFYRADCGRCLQWYETTKGEYFGLAPAILFGRLEDRNFVSLWPGP